MTATPTDHYVEVNGLTIHYLDWGGDSPRNLLLVHGRAATPTTGTTSPASSATNSASSHSTSADTATPPTPATATP